MKLCGQTFNESRVGSARATTQLMVEMANEEPPVAKIDELIQQRDRIAAARDADKVPSIRRKLLENLQLETTVIFSGLPHRSAIVEALLRSAQPETSANLRVLARNRALAAYLFSVCNREGRKTTERVSSRVAQTARDLSTASSITQLVN